MCVSFTWMKYLWKHHQAASNKFIHLSLISTFVSTTLRNFIQSVDSWRKRSDCAVWKRKREQVECWLRKTNQKQKRGPFMAETHCADFGVSVRVTWLCRKESRRGRLLGLMCFWAVVVTEKSFLLSLLFCCNLQPKRPWAAAHALNEARTRLLFWLETEWFHSWDSFHYLSDWGLGKRNQNFFSSVHKVTESAWNYFCGTFWATPGGGWTEILRNLLQIHRFRVVWYVPKVTKSVWDSPWRLSSFWCHGCC